MRRHDDVRKILERTMERPSLPGVGVCPPRVEGGPKPRTGLEMFEQIVFDDQLAAGDVHEDRVLLHARQEATVDEALRRAGEREREEDRVRLRQVPGQILHRADGIRDFLRGTRPSNPNDVHVEGLATPCDLRSDPAEANDEGRRTREPLVLDGLIESPASDLFRSSHDILRGGEEERHRMLRDGDAVRARIAAHDCGRRKSLEREMVDSGDERLDHPHLSGLLPNSSGNSRGNPMDTTTSAVDHAASRFSGGKSSRIAGSNTPAAFFATAARRSASIGTMNRTRAMGPPTAPRDLALSTAPPRSAFRVTARVALDAAFLEHEGFAALRALRIQAFPQQLRGVAALLLHLDVRLDRPAELVVRLDGRLNASLLHPDVPLDRLRDRVRDRVDALPVVDRDPRAPDALELVDDFVDRDAGPQVQGNEARDAFREGGSISAAAADLREHFEEAFLVLVDRDVQGAVSG